MKQTSRGMINTIQTILASAKRTAAADAVSNSFKTFSCSSIRLYVDVTAETGTATLDIKIQTSPDNTVWYNATVVTQITATGQYTDTATVIGPYIRIIYTVAGSDTPSFTFSVKMSKNNWVS